MSDTGPSRFSDFVKIERRFEIGQAVLVRGAWCGRCDPAGNFPALGRVIGSSLEPLAKRAGLLGGVDRESYAHREPAICAESQLMPIKAADDVHEP